MAVAAFAIIWLTFFLLDIGISLSTSPNLLIDNLSALYLAKK